MALSNNPSKTRRIEQAYRRETRNRHRRFNAAKNQAIRESQENDITRNAQGFDMSEEEFERFIRLLRNQAYRWIIGVVEPGAANSDVSLEQTDEWSKKYLETSYVSSLDRAIKQTAAELRSLGETPQTSITDLRNMFDVATDRALAQMLIGTNALHGETIETLQKRSLNGLVQSVETMLGQLSREIDVARVNPDTGVTQLIKSTTERVRVANSTAEQIASTGTIQAAQEAQINNARVLTERTGEDFNLRWITRNDAKVRDLHARWHGEIMTPDEAEVNILISPWNCRCAFEQVPESRDTKKRQRQFDEERETLIDQERKAALGAI